MASYVGKLIIEILYPYFEVFSEYQKNLLKWLVENFCKPRASDIKSNVTELDENDEQKSGEDTYLVPEDIYGVMI